MKVGSVSRQEDEIKRTILKALKKRDTKTIKHLCDKYGTDYIANLISKMVESRVYT